MKKLTDAVAKDAARTIEKGEASFNEKTLGVIRAMLGECIDENQLEPMNRKLTEIGRRRLTLDDFARIAYVHARSIAENDGDSPYARITAYCAKNGLEYHNRHLKVVTDILLSVEFMEAVTTETRKGQCRKYKLPTDVRLRVYGK